MSNYQQITIVGHVGSIGDLRYTQEGVAVFNFTVAVNEKKDAPPTWFNCTVWRELAETCVQFVRAGMLVLASGRVKASAYTNKQGEAVGRLDVTAHRVVFLSRVEGSAPTPDTELTEDELSQIPF